MIGRKLYADRPDRVDSNLWFNKIKLNFERWLVIGGKKERGRSPNLIWIFQD